MSIISFAELLTESFPKLLHTAPFTKTKLYLFCKISIVFFCIHLQVKVNMNRLQYQVGGYRAKDVLPCKTSPKLDTTRLLELVSPSLPPKEIFHQMQNQTSQDLK